MLFDLLIRPSPTPIRVAVPAGARYGNPSALHACQSPRLQIDTCPCRGGFIFFNNEVGTPNDELKGKLFSSWFGVSTSSFQSGSSSRLDEV